MALGIGQLLLGGLIGSQLGKGGLLGNDDEEEVNPQPQTQPTPTEQPSGGVFGGIGGMVSGISNQLFDGMSQEQVARLGMGFNSMRLNPSDNLAASFQTTINDSTTKRKLTQKDYLDIFDGDEKLFKQYNPDINFNQTESNKKKLPGT